MLKGKIMNKDNEEMELKSCPCCGSNKVSIQETEGCDYLIGCDKCGLQVFDDMKWGKKGFDAKQNVIEKWNTRPKESDKIAEALKMIDKLTIISKLPKGDNWKMESDDVEEVLTKIRNTLTGNE